MNESPLFKKGRYERSEVVACMFCDAWHAMALSLRVSFDDVWRLLETGAAQEHDFYLLKLTRVTAGMPAENMSLQYVQRHLACGASRRRLYTIVECFCVDGTAAFVRLVCYQCSKVHYFIQWTST